jgi:uncharacterized protein
MCSLLYRVLYGSLNISGCSNGLQALIIPKACSIISLFFKLPPFFRNFGKRITKSPKIYFVEVGLAASLLGIESESQLERDPAFGGLFENMVIADAYKKCVHAGKEPKLFFYRDRFQKEVDLLFFKEGNYVPMEIKSSRTYREDFL